MEVAVPAAAAPSAPQRQKTHRPVLQASTLLVYNHAARRCVTDAPRSEGFAGFLEQCAVVWQLFEPFMGFPFGAVRSDALFARRRVSLPSLAPSPWGSEAVPFRALSARLTRCACCRTGGSIRNVTWSKASLSARTGRAGS